MNEAELLFTEILNCDRNSLYLNKKLFLDKDKAALVAAVLKRRLSCEPLQYILGRSDFMGFKFKVSQKVLIPRPETEILVEKTIELVASRWSLVASQRILDLGTGSGCIAISLAKLLPQTEIFATDISRDALALAKTNAKLNKVEDRINFIQSDLFMQLEASSLQCDLIVSNPPYIPTSRISSLQQEIQYEPRIALDGGSDGLDFYHRIAKEASHYLKENGFLVLEIGFGQVEPIKNIFNKLGNFKIIEIVKDYNNIERVLVARRIWIS